MGKKQKRPEIHITPTDMYVIFDGLKIAYRKNTPRFKQWISLEPGWRVLDSSNGPIIEHNGVRVH